MTALKRMFDSVQSAVLTTMQTAVKLTALPEVHERHRGSTRRDRR